MRPAAHAGRRLWLVGAAVLLLAAIPSVWAAQRQYFPSRYRPLPNVAYDGRFTFVRVAYARYGGWAADYPTMEQNLNQIVREITEIRPHPDGTNIHTFDDPALNRYPISYLSEPSSAYSQTRGSSA